MKDVWNAALAHALEAIEEERRKNPDHAPIERRAVGYMVMLEVLQADLGMTDEWFDAISQAADR